MGKLSKLHHTLFLHRQCLCKNKVWCNIWRDVVRLCTGEELGNLFIRGKVLDNYLDV